MVRTRQKGSEATPPERRCVYRKAEAGKAARRYDREAGGAEAEGDASDDLAWPAERGSGHVSSVAAEAARRVAPFVSITPTSPERAKSLTRVFHDDDTLEVTPVATPPDYRSFGDATLPSGSDRRKRRHSRVDEAEKEAWLRMSLARRADGDGHDAEDEASPPSPKKAPFGRPSAPSSAGGSRLPSSLSKLSCRLGKRRVRRSGRCAEASSSSEEECRFASPFSDLEDADDAADAVDPDDAKAPGNRIAYIHVGEGGEADLEAHLKGADNLDIQIYDQEKLPDIDETDMIHGLDHTGTSRDYVDERHRCTTACPVGCQGHLRPNEIVIYESVQWNGKLLDRKR